jgi:hypothetical protein
VDDGFVDGGDTQVFAPGPSTVSGILGPVFLDGAGGAGSIAIVEPVLLPGETKRADAGWRRAGLHAGSGHGRDRVDDGPHRRVGERPHEARARRARRSRGPDARGDPGPRPRPLLGDRSRRAWLAGPARARLEESERCGSRAAGGPRRGEPLRHQEPVAELLRRRGHPRRLPLRPRRGQPRRQQRRPDGDPALGPPHGARSHDRRRAAARRHPLREPRGRRDRPGARLQRPPGAGHPPARGRLPDLDPGEDRRRPPRPEPTGRRRGPSHRNARGRRRCLRAGSPGRRRLRGRLGLDASAGDLRR